MFFVYILQSRVDGGYYIGQTSDIEDRLQRHNEGRVPSTKSRRPFALVRLEHYRSRTAAVARESRLKAMKGNSSFHRLIGQ